jgi:hypothetical protein
MKMPAPEEVALFRVVPEIVSVLDYTKGFAHTDLVSCQDGAARGGSLWTVNVSPATVRERQRPLHSSRRDPKPSVRQE